MKFEECSILKGWHVVKKKKGRQKGRNFILSLPISIFFPWDNVFQFREHFVFFLHSLLLLKIPLLPAKAKLCFPGILTGNFKIICVQRLLFFHAVFCHLHPSNVVNICAHRLRHKLPLHIHGQGVCLTCQTYPDLLKSTREV